MSAARVSAGAFKAAPPPPPLPLRYTWTLYKARNHDALLIGLESFEASGLTVFAILDSGRSGESLDPYAWTIVGYKVVP